MRFAGSYLLVQPDQEGASVMDLSEYVLEPLRKNEGFALYRGQHRNPSQAARSSILLIAPLPSHPTLSSLTSIEHPFPIGSEVDAADAIGLVAVVQHDGRPVLVLENPEGEQLDVLIRQTMKTGQFLRLALAKAFEGITRLNDRLLDEKVILHEQADRIFAFEEVVGTSSVLRAALARVSKVASTDSTVLLTGETGTGKELIARAIHKRSQRCSRAFVSVNCAATPSSLIASELFGHEKGAFTGAVGRRIGRFELAEGGTIFLDEVGELPAETQITLLRVLQEREFERVGGNQLIRANVRVIAATNRDLEAAIAGATFRSDLFYRLNVFPIELPPLRDRRDDIPLLARHFIDRFARKAGKTIRGIHKKSLDLLLTYPWPGNIRELQNVIERSVIVCETEYFSVDDSWLSRKPLAVQTNGHSGLSRLAGLEKEVIEAALLASKGVVSGPSGAAAWLGIPGTTLESKIRALRIDKRRFKTAGQGKPTQGSP
jgi:transcriptional regulator with GAF, ATPase, and Fis domain